MNSLPADFPKTLQEAIAYFSDPDKAFNDAVALRWPKGIACPRCDSKKHSFISTRKIWFCKGCKKQFTIKVGSIFEDSPLGMDKWMFAVWLVGNCKNGVSSCEVARHLGITQKSAWFMDHRIRAAMHPGSFRNKLSGQIEADETFVGGKARYMHKDVRERKVTGTGGKDKVAVLGILERGGKVRTKVVENTRKKSLQKELRDHVLAGSAIFTDSLKSYEGLNEFQHEVVDHAVEYVTGEVHTNGLENFWSLLKRGLKGTYVSVEPFHLFQYLDEQAYRYNNRKAMADADRFVDIMHQASGKRLTWDELTGKIESSSSSERPESGNAKAAESAGI